MLSMLRMFNGCGRGGCCGPDHQTQSRQGHFQFAAARAWGAKPQCNNGKCDSPRQQSQGGCENGNCSPQEQNASQLGALFQPLQTLFNALGLGELFRNLFGDGQNQQQTGCNNGQCAPADSQRLSSISI